MNKVMLLGRITRELEVTKPRDTEVLKFSVAINRKFNKEVDFINCVAFGKTAEFINKFFKKGSMIGLSGRIQVGSYTSKDGKKINTTDVIIEEAYFTGEKPINQQETKPVSEKQYIEFEEVQDDDDFPY